MTSENAVDKKKLVLEKPLDLQESPFSSLVFFNLEFEWFSRAFTLFTSLPEETGDPSIRVWR